MMFTYACEVHTEKIFPIIKKYIQQYGTSQNENERAASVTHLGQIVDPDACLDFVRDDMNAFTNFLIDRMQDDSIFVREQTG